MIIYYRFSFTKVTFILATNFIRFSIHQTKALERFNGPREN